MTSPASPPSKSRGIEGHLLLRPEATGPGLIDFRRERRVRAGQRRICTGAPASRPGDGSSLSKRVGAVEADPNRRSATERRARSVGWWRFVLVVSSAAAVHGHLRQLHALRVRSSCSFTGGHEDVRARGDRHDRDAPSSRGGARATGRRCSPRSVSADEIRGWHRLLPPLAGCMPSCRPAPE